MSYPTFLAILIVSTVASLVLLGVKMVCAFLHPRSSILNSPWPTDFSWFAVPLPFLLGVAWVSAPYIYWVLRYKLAG